MRAELCFECRHIVLFKPLNPQGTGPTRQGYPIQRSLAISCIIEPLILCCYIIKVVLLLHFHLEKCLNPFLFKLVYGKFHWDSPFATRTKMTHSKSSMWSFEPFFLPATLLRTLNCTFHSPHHRGIPLNDDRERKIPSHCPMIPFCCQAGISLDRESNMASSRWMVLKVTGSQMQRLHVKEAQFPTAN